MGKRRGNWQEILIYAVSLLAVLMFIWYLLGIHAEDMRFDSEQTYRLDQGWQAEVNGRTYQVTLPARVEAKSGETVSFRKVLPKQESYCNTLMVHTSHQYVRFLLDGEVLWSYGENQTTPVKMSPGAPWQCVRLPEGWEGKELVIETTAYYDTSAGFMEEVYMGTKNALAFMVFKKAWMPLLLNLPILLAGMAMTVTSLFFKEKNAVRKLRYIGLFAVITSVWIMLESRITQVFTGNILVCMNLIFILFALLPVYILYYLLSYSVFKRSRYMRVIYGVAAGNFVAIQLLRALGVVDYMKSVSWVHAVLVLVVAGIIYIYVKEKKSGQEQEKDVQSLFRAVFVLAAFGAVDVVRFYFPKEISEAVVFTRVGLFCFIMILAFSAIREEVQDQEKRIERQTLEKLAYTDMLTGLGNRTAFEAQMDQYRHKTSAAAPILFVTDMNGLKYINDTYGHTCGDRAIIGIADCLKKVFGKQGECYRIGGDEFCVISEQLTEEEMRERMRRYMQDVAEADIGFDCQMTVAGGYARCGGDGIDRAFTEADQRMYECKAIMKNGMDEGNHGFI